MVVKYSKSRKWRGDKTARVLADPDAGLGHIERGSPMPLPRSFESSKAWAQEPLRRQRLDLSVPFVENGKSRHFKPLPSFPDDLVEPEDT